jgi:hypothetical protein
VEGEGQSFAPAATLRLERGRASVCDEAAGRDLLLGAYWTLPATIATVIDV